MKNFCKSFAHSTACGWLILLVIAVAILVIPTSVSTTPADPATSEPAALAADPASPDDALLSGLRSLGAEYNYDVGEFDELGSLAYAVKLTEDKGVENLSHSETLLCKAACIEFVDAMLKSGDSAYAAENLLQECQDWLYDFHTDWSSDFNDREDAAWADWEANHSQWTAEQNRQWDLDHDVRWAEFSAIYDKMASVGRIMLDLQKTTAPASASTVAGTV